MLVCSPSRLAALPWGPPQVSAIVRAPPSDVFKNLVQQRRTEGLGVLMGARVVEKIDANTQVRVLLRA